MYASWAFFWSLWPSNYHVTPANYNWACPIFFGFMGLACIMYRFDGKRRYEAPVHRVQTWMNVW